MTANAEAPTAATSKDMTTETMTTETMTAETMTAKPPVLEARGLVKAFGGVKAVDDVSLAVESGRLLALIGPNGAGKTTCFNMLNGQLRPDAGRVLLSGRDITGRAPREVWRMGVGRTFQITATFASMTVRENVQTALLSHHGQSWRTWGRAREAFLQEADALLGQVGMASQADRACGILAYGDLKRVELAVALANAPSLLLMDEPTAGMAPSERIGLMELTSRLARERSIAVLFTEHDMDVVFAHADRVMVLDRGRLIADGQAKAVRADPAVQAVYLGRGFNFGEP
jgi:branched-chain amino acid transport system ATP-binding protein